MSSRRRRPSSFPKGVVRGCALGQGRDEQTLDLSAFEDAVETVNGHAGLLKPQFLHVVTGLSGLFACALPVEVEIGVAAQDAAIPEVIKPGKGGTVAGTFLLLPVNVERSEHGVGLVAHFSSQRRDAFTGCGGDGRTAVEGQGNGRVRHARLEGNLPHGDARGDFHSPSKMAGMLQPASKCPESRHAWFTACIFDARHLTPGEGERQSAWFHVDRVADGNRHHRHSGRTDIRHAGACAVAGAAGDLHQPGAATGRGVPIVCQRKQGPPVATGGRGNEALVYPDRSLR